MKNLGKIVGIILFMSLNIYGSVIASVSPKIVYKGEDAVFELSITGQEINKPLLDSLCGSDILETSSSTSITMINGDYKKSYTLSYTFSPEKNCTIAPIAVKVDGKMEKSNAVSVVVKPPQQDKGADFLLTLQPSKKEVYVGEPFYLTLVLKQKLNAEVVDSQFQEPDFKGFWVKEKSKPIRKEEGDYLLTIAKYKLAPQRVGNITIKPAKLRIASRINERNMWGGFMPQVKWRSFYSNSVVMDVKPLPNSAKLVGNFTLHARADKTTINPNEAVNVTIEVIGDGNLEDIKSFKPYIQGVNIFDEKIVIKGNKLTQKLAFVSDNNFTIPSFHLDFFNLQTKKVQRITTQPIDITVRGSVKKQETPVLEMKRSSQIDSQANRSDMQDAISYGWMVLVAIFVLGIGVGVAFMFYQPWKRLEKEKKINLKDQKILLIKLMEFKDKDTDVQHLVDTLEANLYGTRNKPIDKKLLKEVIKRHNIV